MHRSIRVAAVQLRAHERAEFERALPVVLEEVADAARGADLVVLPEGTLPAYVVGREPLDPAPIARALEAIGRIARETQSVVVVGSAVIEGAHTFNAGVVIERDGTIAGHADKSFLWHFDREWFSPGERLEPIHTSLGALGVFVCADGRIPTLARALVDRGAEILVMPTAWVTSGRDPASLENAQADLMAQVRAWENGVPLVAANKCGSEAGCVAYCGKSQIVDALGQVVALAGEREPETLHAAVTLGSSAPHRRAAATPTSQVTAHREAAGLHRARIAISPEPLRPGDAEHLQLLGDAFAITPHDAPQRTALAAFEPFAEVDDACIDDPGGLATLRLGGSRLALWTTHRASPWTARLARTRALELRMYVVVLDLAEKRAFAVDPDGAILCGTFGAYRLACFVFDPARVAQTLVAPNTDVLDGLRRVALVTRERSVR